MTQCTVAHQRYSQHNSSSLASRPTADGRSSDTDQQKPQPLSAIAQQAYDRYGVLDPIKLDLMVRGIFITREDAAALPHRITTDGCAEVKAGGSHYQRPCVSQAAPRLATVTPTKARTSRATRAPSVVSSSTRTDISAIPSDHEKWAESEIKLLIKLRSEMIGFRDIAVRPDPSAGILSRPCFQINHMHPYNLHAGGGTQKGLGRSDRVAPEC